MEADSKSVVIIETGQEIESLDVNKSSEAELLSDSQNELQGAVIIYDNESQEGQVVKLITNIKSEDVSDQNPDPDNVITLHASSNDSKDETIEENIIALPSQETIKTEAFSNPEDDPETDDDETIATFVTSTGQQLALYAVEDSDEIFAVALYDESGEPPTNFHFLMKSDVERLIGEGAVKTVKKPSAQAKRQMKPVEKKEEEIKFERVTQPIIPLIEKKEDILEKSIAEIKTEILEIPQSPVTVQELVEMPTSPVKVQEVVEVSKPQATVQQIVEVPVPQAKVQEVTLQKKELPKKIVTKNHNVNNKSIAPTKQIVNQAKPAVTSTRQIVTHIKPGVSQARLVATQVRPIAGQSRPVTQVKHVITHPKQSATQAKHIITQPTRQIISQPRQIVTQQRQIIVQPRQIVTQQRQFVTQQRQIIPQQRKYVAQPKHIVTQAKQMVLPARQYVNQTKQYVSQGKQLVYQAKPQTQPVKSVITPLKKPVANQKEKITYVLQNQDESYVVDLDSDAEILEQSTVQYILCDENPSDSELTFDELQASIQSFKTGKPPAPTVEVPKAKKDAITFSPTIRSTPKPATILTPKKQLATPVYRTYKSPKKARMTNNLLQAHRKIKQEVVDPSYGDFDDGHISDDLSQSMQNSTLDSSSGVKVKRSRKQQLTVVNRGDSEIIIQPAPAYSEEEEEPVVLKRRGRRKKKATPDPDYNPRQTAKKGRRSTRLVEVIDIDVDESERSNVMEITLDGKKGSSDKENDVISVDDTDEEDKSGPRKKMRKPMMQCTHCMRNFRKRRALERHVQICPKSPAILENLEERKKLGIDKKFKCKSCDEYFDIAVALARHVRVVHSPRKRGRPPKGWTREDKSETEVTDESMDGSTPDRDVAPKKRGRPPLKRSVSLSKESVSKEPVSKESVSKETEKSPAPEGESKSETPADEQPQPQPQSQSTSSEPRRRGRPPGKRSFYVEKSVTPELEDKAVSSDEKKTDVATPEVRKRGRPPKRSTSQGEESEDVEEKAEEKIENASESSTLPKKRGRPKKKSTSKDEETDNADGEEKTESSTETLSVEPKKRGRPPKRTMSRDGETDDARSTESEDKPEDESTKKQKVSEEEPEKKSEEPRRRGRPPKDKLISIKEEKIVESSEAETETEEPRKRGRPTRSMEPESSKKIKTEVDEMEEVVLIPSQTGKLKKLNCSECGKWFSSVAALNAHQLHQHRTKKSAIVVNRCPDCNTLVPHNAYAKHMSMQHGKSLPSTSTAKTEGSTSTITTQVVQSAEKTVKVVQRSLRSSN